MSLRRKHYPRTERYIPHGYGLRSVGDAEAAGLLLDDSLDSIVCQVRDPFATYVNRQNYLIPPVLDMDVCMDSVVAGVSEALGLPTGLTFDEVFARIE